MRVLPIVWLLAMPAAAQDAPQPHPPVPTVRAARVAVAIRVDGALDEPAWSAVAAFTDFRQSNPDEGQPASEPTDLRLLYDDHAVYVGARLHDREANRIVRRLARRDTEADADLFGVAFDTALDHTTGVAFIVSAAGVQRDLAFFNDVSQDVAWDAVWESAVTVDAAGWTVEMRIPYSQLRFPALDAPVWGIQAHRFIQRKHEDDFLSLVPKTENVFVSRWAHLEGLQGISRPRNLELLPYVTARAEYITPASANDPFNDGSEFFAGAGLDVKYGVTSTLTLDATVNPDFGQVEVDPAVVNLTAFETFFEEKRPFFTEGSRIFSNYGKNGPTEAYRFFRPDPGIFYSRRIGRAPQGAAPGPYVDVPTSTTILGAAKLTGRTAGGWTVGAVEAVTGREEARTAGFDSQTATLEVEPLTNYLVGRAFREIGRGAIGMIGTAVHRGGADPLLEAQLPGQSYVAGTDGYLFLDAARTWVVAGNLTGSHVGGSTASMLRLQRHSARYYQRPDAPHVSVDPDATSLSGWSGGVDLNRNKGNWNVNASLWGISPGFDSNDAGFITQTDRGGAHGLVRWRKTTPDRFTRFRSFWVNKWWTWNYGRESQGDGILGNATFELRNYWRIVGAGGVSWDTWDDKLTRGGPTTIRPGIRNVSLSLSSDSRRAVTFGVSGLWQERNFNNWTRQFGFSAQFKPSAAVTVSTGPTYVRTHNQAQYLRTVVDPTATATFGSRYVFGTLDQTETAFETRLNVVLSPRLSLQMYVQPLVSAGDYPAIKELAAPRTYDFRRYGIDQGTLDVVGGAYVIDPDGDGPARSFTVANPDFNFKSLRANTVLRWEWKPGSALFIVWTQNRADGTNPGDYQFPGDFGRLFDAAPDNVFLVKTTWWVGR